MHVSVMTPYGAIRIKVAGLEKSERVNHTPEFDDCLAAAKEHGVALREVQLAALAAYRALEADSST